jgi:hypothetical protein
MLTSPPRHTKPKGGLRRRYAEFSGAGGRPVRPYLIVHRSTAQIFEQALNAVGKCRPNARLNPMRSAWGAPVSRHVARHARASRGTVPAAHLLRAARGRASSAEISGE